MVAIETAATWRSVSKNRTLRYFDTTQSKVL